MIKFNVGDWVTIYPPYLSPTRIGMIEGVHLYDSNVYRVKFSCGNVYHYSAASLFTTASQKLINAKSKEKRMKFPDFVIIGSMKCGTTALWHNLNHFPDIQMGKNPDDPKKTSTEIRFWNNGGPHYPWRRGLTWYKSLFSGTCAGEKCANYIESPSAMRLMCRHMPEAKIVVCIRNPVDRVLSEFWMHNFKPEKIKKFNKFAEAPGPRARSCYYDQLQRAVLPFYPKDQIYVVIQERMLKDTNKELNNLRLWLGLPFFNAPVNHISFRDRDLHIGGLRVWETEHKVDMSTSLRGELNEYFKPHNDKLFDWLGYSIDDWVN